MIDTDIYVGGKRKEENSMDVAIAFAIGVVFGMASLLTWAVCASNTAYKEKLKRVKTNEDMLKLADSKQLRRALKRMYWQNTMYLSPLLREVQERKIDEWLEKEADSEWRE